MPKLAKGGFVRRNGWERPGVWQQYLAWILVVLIGLLYFGLVAPQFATRYRAMAVALPAAFVGTFVALLFACTTADPADPAVRYNGSCRPAASFDRSKRRHVIVDRHCYFCQVRVGERSKHCSACNKCVGEFDHHCMWMNSCVGGKTYRMFFASISSGTIGTALMLSFCAAIVAGDGIVEGPQYCKRKKKIASCPTQRTPSPCPPYNTVYCNCYISPFCLFVFKYLLFFIASIANIPSPPFPTHTLLI